MIALRRRIAALVALAALGVGGCMWEWGYHTKGGFLTIAWSVNESTAPSACSMVGAATTETVVYDAGGGRVARDESRCDAFEATYSLARGSYTVTIRLLDDVGRSLGALYSADVYVASSTTSTVDVDLVAPYLVAH